MADFSELASESGGFSQKCNTCRACFSSIEKIKDHYKGDWHIFNSKRRANSLQPVSKEDYKDYIKKNPKPPVRRPVLKAAASEVSNNAIEANAAEKDDQQVDEEDEDQPIQDGDDEEAGEIYTGPIGANTSIFDGKVFENPEEALDYMKLNFGFFIPDGEYLDDLPGLLDYLGEKVKLGGICLYCQKQFKTGRSCQNHMKTTSHCKLAYEEGVDMEEFEDFYDFSAQYDDDDDGEEQTLKISANGELQLLDGRTLGHKDFRIYFKQHFSPEETRPSVLAMRREQLLKIGAEFGGQQVKNDELMNMSDTQVRAELVKYHKQLRRGQMVEQRATRKKEWLSQRREVKSKIDKARSSATTTAKIRDYHSVIA